MNYRYPTQGGERASGSVEVLTPENHRLVVLNTAVDRLRAAVDNYPLPSSAPAEQPMSNNRDVDQSTQDGVASARGNVAAAYLEINDQFTLAA